MTTPDTPQDPQNFQPATPPAAPPVVPPAAPAAEPAAQSYQAAAPAAPAYQPAPAASQPGKVLGIVGLILAFIIPPVGLILGIVALVQSKKAGAKNGIALTAIILGAIFTIAWILFWIIIGITAASLGGSVMEIAELCQSGAESVEFMGETIRCTDVMN